MTIGVWGASITYGSCDSEALGWVGRMRKALPTDDNMHVYNLGICGDTSKRLVARFSREVQAIRPDRVLFEIGINDAKFPKGSNEHKVSLGDYEKNLERLISESKAYTNDITLVGATRVSEGWRTARGNRFCNEEIQKFNKVMRRVAEQHKLPYIDVFGTLDPEVDLADGIHPNAGGYQKMFETIIAKLNWV